MLFDNFVLNASSIYNGTVVFSVQCSYLCDDIDHMYATFEMCVGMK